MFILLGNAQQIYPNGAKVVDYFCTVFFEAEHLNVVETPVPLSAKSFLLRDNTLPQKRIPLLSLIHI